MKFRIEARKAEHVMALQASLSPTSTMPLKTVPNVDSPAVEPRRSERIASKPGVTAVTETKKESKKRLAEKATSVEAGDDPSSLKKVGLLLISRER